MSAVATWITALATVAMVWVGWRNYELYRQAHKQNEQRQDDFNDLLEALVISTILSGPSSVGSLDEAVRAFNTKYKGKRQIFKQS